MILGEFFIFDSKKALFEAYRLKLVEGYHGALRIDTDGDNIYLTQGRNQAELETLAKIPNSTTWSDIIPSIKYLAGKPILTEYEWIPDFTRKITPTEARENNLPENSLVVEDNVRLFESIPMWRVLAKQIQRIEEKLQIILDGRAYEQD